MFCHGKSTAILIVKQRPFRLIGIVDSYMFLHIT